MHAIPHGFRTLTELDHVRLEALLRRTPGATDAGAALVDLLDQADQVPSRQIDPDIVTMYSRVLVRDEPDGATRTLCVCWPQDAAPEEGFVSVLSPIGAALLGCRVGATFSWRTPTGDAREARVVGMLFQPEASGDFTA